MKTVVTALVVLASLLAACDKGGVIARIDVPPDVPDTADVADAEDVTTDPGDTIETDLGPPVPHDIVTQVPYIPARSFRFEMGGREGDIMVVDVVARSFDKVFGIAMRVEWDAKAMTLVDAAPEALFDGGVQKAAEVRPGSLAIGMAFLGNHKERSLDGDVKVATLRFKPAGPGPTELRFFAAKCLVITKDWDKVEATYLASMVYP